MQKVWSYLKREVKKAERQLSEAPTHSEQDFLRGFIAAMKNVLWYMVLSKSLFDDEEAGK
jgi:hypothetical protein